MLANSKNFIVLLINLILYSMKWNKSYRSISWRSKIFLIFMFTFLTFPLLAGAQGFVKGTVTDESGNPLIGVTIMVKGTNVGTLTNIDGNYTIKSGPNDELVFSYVGMTTKTVKVNGKSTINVELQENSVGLDELVVVGYGVQKKSSITSAVSAIKGDELLLSPSTNITSILGGKLPGISSVQESGEPGLDQASLKIRGSQYSVSYIVDGIPRQINDIDPNDIESVSVLKDAAAAAVYGLKGAGGVIIVTTKKGNTGSPKITYSGSVGGSFNANFPQFMDGPQFAHYYNMGEMMDQLGNGVIADRSQYKPKYTGEMVKMMLNGDPTDGWDNVNYIDKVFGTGINTKHNITAQGGTENMRYFTSLGYLGQTGNIDNFNYNRYTVRANVESKVAKYWTFNLGVSGNVSDRKTPGFASGGSDNDPDLGEQGWMSIGHQTIGMHPYLPEKMNGLYTATPIRNTGLPQSPLAAIYDSGYKKTNAVDIQTNLSIQFDVPWVKGLTAKATGSYDYSTSHNKNLNTNYSVSAVNLSNFKFSEQTDPRGKMYNSLGEGQVQSTQLLGQLQLNYNKTFGKHSVGALALFEIRDYKSNSLSAYAKNIDFPDLPELGLGEPDDSPIGGYSKASRSMGYVFRVNYDYNNRYIAEVTGRYDGSYKFAGNVAGKRWAFFPSASVAWRMSQESFMADVSFINDLKVRASVGLLGNDAVSEYAFLSKYKFGNPVNINGNFLNSLYTDLIANPNLTWENTLTYNFGFDFNMWNSLLAMEFDVFYNYTYNILTSMGSDYPGSMGGYYPTYANFDKTDARGFEVTLTHRNNFLVAGKRFDYSISGNLSYAKNRYLRHPDSPNIPEWDKVVGSSIDATYGWTADGLYRTEEEIDNSAWYGSRPNVGDIRYVDLNGDGKIDSQDRGRIGRGNRPQITFGLNLSANWNGIDFNAQFTGGALFDVSLLGTYYNGYDDNTIWTQTFKENSNSPLYLVENAVSIDNPNGTMPRITTGTLTHGSDNGLASTFWFRNGKYIRLKSAQLGYTLPDLWMKAVGIQALRVFVEGSNLFTIDGLPDGIDPESPSVNNGYYPQQRTVMGGLTLTF